MWRSDAYRHRLVADLAVLGSWLDLIIAEGFSNLNAPIVLRMPYLSGLLQRNDLSSGHCKP